MFGCLNKYPNQGYDINPQPLTNQYSYFREEINDRFPEPLLDELDMNIFVDSDHGYDKVTGRSITGLLSMVV